MITVHLTRHDGTDHNYDSIQWALEVHVRSGLMLNQTEQFQYAVLTGNEDSPDKIEFWYDLSPQFDQRPDFIWTPNDPESRTHRVTIHLDTEDNSCLNDCVRFALGLQGMLNSRVTSKYTVYQDEWLAHRDEDEDELPF